MKNKIFILIAILLTFLVSCGKAGDSEHTVSVSNSTVVEEPATLVETKTDVTEPNTVRLNGDYDSVPTVTVPERLSSEELDSIVIPVSADDPYSAIIANEIEWYKQASSGFNSEDERYFLYDINGDSVNELIIGHISALGGS